MMNIILLFYRILTLGKQTLATPQALASSLI